MKMTTAAAGHALPRLPYAPALLIVATLALLLAGVIAPRPELDLAVDDPAAPRALVRFYPIEWNGPNTYRWSEPLAGVFLYGYEGRPALVTLRLAAPRPEGEPLATTRLSVRGEPIGELTLTDAWRHYHLIVPTHPTGETALLLETPAYVPPADPRELGVALSSVQLRAAGDGRGVPPVRALYLLALPLLAWLLLVRLGAPAWAALAGGALFAAVAGWAAAFPVDAGYLLPTLGWPWWPFVPLVLLLAWPQLGSGLRRSRVWFDADAARGWAAVGVALAAILGMRAGLPWPLGLGLLVGGTWAALGLIERGGMAQREAVRPQLAGLGLLGVLALALLLRLWNLDGLPAGLWRDESRHALQALRIWNNPAYRPIYVVEGADLPALLFYLMAPVLGLLGPHAWSARLVSALAGALTPLALYWAAAPMLGRRPALLGAALLACASWGLSMSRWAFPATLDHLLVLTAVGLVWRSLDSGRQAAAARGWGLVGMGLAGLLGGLAMYAYHTGRVAPLALGAVAAIRLGWSPEAWRRAAPGLAVAALAGALTIAPLAAYILGDLDGYNRRVGSVSLLDSNNPAVHTPAGLLLGNMGRYLMMFHVQGDINGRHHMPLVPMLDPLAGLGLALGFALALRQVRRSPGVAAVLALGGVYLIPAVFSSNAPHAMRSLGVLAPAAMLAGLGLYAVAWSLRPRAGSGRALPGAVCAAVLAVSLGFNSWLYFGAMRVEPAVYGEFDLLETAMGRVAAAPARSADPALAAVRVYLPAGLFEEDTVSFLTWDLPTFGYSGQALPADGPVLLLLPADATAAEQAAALADLGPGAEALGPAAFYPGTERPLVLAFGRGPAAGALLAQALP